MTPDQFQTAACAILGTTIGWQTKIAQRLGVRARTVRYWLAGRPIPDWVETKLGEMMGGMDPTAAWPRDEWIVGDALDAAGRRREYVIHTAPPRFVARVVVVDDDSGLPLPDEEPADVLIGIVYSADAETVLAEIDWIDTPRPGEVTQLLEAAADAVDRS